jgi:hypothetical protein
MDEEAFDALLEQGGMGAPRVKAIREQSSVLHVLLEDDEPEGCRYPVGGIYEPPEDCGGPLDPDSDELCTRHLELEVLGEEQASRQEAEAEVL